LDRGANPTIAIYNASVGSFYNASVVSFYNATGSLEHFENKKYLLLLKTI
jgi:tetrahydromethanopterin S-methyltransferase subunit D